MILRFLNGSRYRWDFVLRLCSSVSCFTLDVCCVDDYIHQCISCLTLHPCNIRGRRRCSVQGSRPRSHRIPHASSLPLPQVRLHSTDAEIFLHTSDCRRLEPSAIFSSLNIQQSFKVIGSGDWAQPEAVCCDIGCQFHRPEKQAIGVYQHTGYERGREGEDHRSLTGRWNFVTEIH